MRKEAGMMENVISRSGRARFFLPSAFRLLP
jgi:hypothetical protein